MLHFNRHFGPYYQYLLVMLGLKVLDLFLVVMCYVFFTEIWISVLHYHNQALANIHIIYSMKLVQYVAMLGLCGDLNFLERGSLINLKFQINFLGYKFNILLYKFKDGMVVTWDGTHLFD